jgi:general secretion pathway protein G
MARDRGFTLIELLVTLAIIAALASIAMPLNQVVQQRSREDELRRALWQIRDAIDAYKRASDEQLIASRSDADSGYPPTLQHLVDGVPDQKRLDGRKLYFLRRIPRDPMCDCPSRSNAQTWGLRSYASSPELPRPGKDVYDVYSTSTRNGLDGVAYKEW